MVVQVAQHPGQGLFHVSGLEAPLYRDLSVSCSCPACHHMLLSRLVSAVTGIRFATPQQIVSVAHKQKGGLRLAHTRPKLAFVYI